MNYETKMRMLQWVKPENKDKLLAKLVMGETVDITKDEDLFYQINVDRLPIEKLIDRQKYIPVAKQAKQTRDIIRNGHRLRYKGEIPDALYFTHPMFSPLLSHEERQANIEKFFRMFPKFKGE